METAMARIWQEILRVDRVGRDDNFFELGGHSLLVMQMLVRVRSILSMQIPMRLMFEYPTLKHLSAQLEEQRRDSLLNSLSSGGADIDEMLKTVASMPEGEVQQLLNKLRGGARS
jgi:acyl carrier protein